MSDSSWSVEAKPFGNSGKALASSLVEAKDALDDMNDVLDLAVDAGLLVFQFSEPAGSFALNPGIVTAGLLS